MLVTHQHKGQRFGTQQELDECIYLKQVQEESREADEGGLLACRVINDMQAAPEARIHAAEHGHTA